MIQVLFLKITLHASAKRTEAMIIDDVPKRMQERNSFKPFHFDFLVFLTHATILLSLKLDVT